VLFDPPQRAGYCDRCKKKLVVRSDSRPSVVAHRLDVYERQTRPIIAYFKRQRRYHYTAVNGEWAKEKINKFILKKIS
jgi:adenylate kinase